MSGFRRRDVIAGSALLLVGRQLARGEIIAGQLPWHPGASAPPQPIQPGSWRFFTPAEAEAVEALADRIIPPDPQTFGGKEAGCAVFIDRQLAGAYGHREGLYVSGPFQPGTKEQGPQSSQPPSQLYRAGLAALDQYCRSEQAPRGKDFARLTAAQQDAVLGAMESGSVHFEGVDTQTFFEQLLKDVQEGFFADPLYGGNRDMCSWKMIGFPGARYDYTDWVGRHNERYPYPPVSISGRPDWNPPR
jgi:gluconate 2-dehydrogenase gamma chain